MKTKQLLIACILISFISTLYIGIAYGASYEMAVQEDDEYIWTLNILDEDQMEDLWGKDWDDSDFWDDAEVGARMRAEIKDVEDGEEYLGIGGYPDSFLVEADFWYFDTVEGDKWGDEDVELSLYALEDPDDYADDTAPSQWAFFWPTPVEEYWDEIDWHSSIDIDGLTITVELEEDDIYWGGIADDDCDIVLQFNENGVLSNGKLLNSDDEVVVEFALGGIVPGYDIPILLGITAVFTIGIIYVMKKRI